jgi:DNA-binding CsgD family transcriptional regulator
MRPWRVGMSWRQTDRVVQVLCPTVVGRERELAVLEARLAAALEGDGCCVALAGEAGVGKSRLVRELGGRARVRGAQVVVGRATPSGEAGAYRPLSEALLQALRGRQMPQDPGLAPWVPALAGIVPFAGALSPAAETSEAARGEAVVRFLGRLAEPSGLVVVLEDLHWADPDTLSVVEYLTDNVAGQRLLVAVTIRSEERTAGLELLRRQRGRQGIVQLDLGRLDPDAVTEMVLACDPDAPVSLIERVHHSAEGVPLLVEELLASPGVPTSFAETVRERLARFDAATRQVIEAAAVLGRHFDWQLLAPVTALPPAVVTEALAAGVERLLLRVEDGAFGFRHALTREAVLDELLPPRAMALAEAALAEVKAAHPGLSGPWRDLAADLAARCGARHEAGSLLLEAAREALARGGLGTATEVLSRIVRSSDDGDVHDQAVLLLVEALALAGRVDEAVAAARPVLGQEPGRELASSAQAELRLRLAQAAVAGGRWQMATDQLNAARAIVGDHPDGPLAARIEVLEAEVALAGDDVGLARRQADSALARTAEPSEVRCHALEILGRIERLGDHPAAHRCFEQALASAEAAHLPVWRIRALHELGTIEMFDHLGTGLLDQARRSAEEAGALSITAVIELQLAALHISRWMPAAAAAHARSALHIAETLALTDVAGKARLFLAESCALRADVAAVEHFLAQSPSEPDSPLEGFSWGARGEAALAAGDIPAAIEHLGRATGILARYPHAEPAAFRALWPLLLASAGDRRAGTASEQAHRLGVGAFSLNRGLLGYADAILRGRAGDASRAAAMAAEAERGFVNCPTWRTLARVLTAGAAADAGWGQPGAWLAEGAEVFTRQQLPGLAGWCQSRLASQAANRWERLGITAREADVLGLVADGLANKQIAARLRVSPRTVEKHIEALLRKTSSQSRTQLAVLAAGASAHAGKPATNR